MTTLNWNAIEKAGSDFCYIANAMESIGRSTEEIIETLERFEQTGDMEDPIVQAALGIDPESDARWMDIQSADIDRALAEIEETERRGHIYMDAAD